MRHDFHEYWTPQPGAPLLDIEVHVCENCGLEIKNPHDEYPISECPPVKAMSDEWLQYTGYGTECDLRIVEAVHES